MRDHGVRGRSQVVEQGADVAGEAVDTVGADAARLARQVVAAQVGRDGAEAGIGQRRELMAPGPPELGKAVQEEDRRAVGWAELDDV